MAQKGAETIYFVGAIGGLVRMWPMDEDNVISTKKTGKRLRRNRLRYYRGNKARA